ncbi:MAG: hypothetical protein ACK4Q5_09130 [Saprospiraceae bacterium]
MNPLPQTAPLSNLQLHLLKVYANGISEEELLDIRRMLARYFMERAVRGATHVWREKGYSAQELLNEPS